MRIPHGGRLGFLAIFLSVSAALAYSGSRDTHSNEQLQIEKVLWVEPGEPGVFDFQFGVGGEDRLPQPPFRFLNEDLSRTTDKINVIDDRGTKWNVKWGSEVGPSTFCTRLLRACGYFAATEYFLPAGRIEGAHDLTRSKKRVKGDGRFVNARFQLRAEWPKYLQEEHWKLSENPFVGSRELQGLKIFILLLSNWDNRPSNFGIFEQRDADQARDLYLHTDWGAALGGWGNFFTRSKGRCKDFTRQTSDFVKGVKDGTVVWGFGNIDDIGVNDVRWLLQYLGKITDEQLRSGLSASGESPTDTECYTRALRQRIEQLERIAATD
jgi:hypothetical protein